MSDAQPLWGIVLPQQTNILGHSERTIRTDSTTKPAVLCLEWLPAKKMVLIRMEEKPGMPDTVLIPQEQISVIIPMPEGQPIKGDFTRGLDAHLGMRDRLSSQEPDTQGPVARPDSLVEQRGGVSEPHPADAREIAPKGKPAPRPKRKRGRPRKPACRD